MRPYLQIFSPESDKERASFDLYLPANGAEEFYTCYHFVYEVNPPDPALLYGEGPNNPANRRFYRIKTAFVTVKGEDGFRPIFRALQQGEIGLAFREAGAGDFVGGFHGDEVLTEVSLTVDGREVPLDVPFFGTFETLSFYERSDIFRCNTPSEPIARHTQTYTADGGTLRLAQRVEWTADGKPLQAAYMPMLTAQRLDPQAPERILSDTVEFYGKDGALVRSFDTTPYGAVGNGKQWDTVCEKTPATAVRVYGKASGFSAEAGYSVVGDTIPEERCTASLCIRYMKGGLDNKIYFEIGGGAAPKKGTVWQSDAYYRVTYVPRT